MGCLCRELGYGNLRVRLGVRYLKVRRAHAALQKPAGILARLGLGHERSGRSEICVYSYTQIGLRFMGQDVAKALAETHRLSAEEHIRVHEFPVTRVNHHGRGELSDDMRNATAAGSRPVPVPLPFPAEIKMSEAGNYTL